MAKATAALMPAFSTGFKYNTTNPYDFGALLTALSTGNYARYFEDMSQAFTPQGVADGNGILGQLFGSKEMSRAIAAQAAQMTGIGRRSTSRCCRDGEHADGGALQTDHGADERWAGRQSDDDADEAMDGGDGPRQEARTAVNPFDNPFTQAMQGFFGMGKAGETGKAGEKAESSRPFRRQSVLQGLCGDDAGAPTRRRKRRPITRPSPSFSQAMNTSSTAGWRCRRNIRRASTPCSRATRAARAQGLAAGIAPLRGTGHALDWPPP